VAAASGRLVARWLQAVARRRGGAAARWRGSALAGGALNGGEAAASVAAWRRRTFSSRAKTAMSEPAGKKAWLLYPGTKGLRWGVSAQGPLVPVCGTDRD
jgi:hypothetical protein